MPAKESGFRLNGEIRNFQEVTTSKGKVLVVARSNDSLEVFKVKGR
jgi:hypothetical protein